MYFKIITYLLTTMNYKDYIRLIITILTATYKSISPQLLFKNIVGSGN